MLNMSSVQDSGVHDEEPEAIIRPYVSSHLISFLLLSMASTSRFLGSSTAALLVPALEPVRAELDRELQTMEMPFQSRRREVVDHSASLLDLAEHSEWVVRRWSLASFTTSVDPISKNFGYEPGSASFDYHILPLFHRL